MSRKAGFRKRPLRALRRAYETYNHLTELLRNRIHAASTGGEDGQPDLKHLMTTILAHQNALKTVQDLESGVEKQLGERVGLASDGLDFDKARAEIMGKLARLFARERG